MLFIGFFAYSIIRHRFLDIRFILRKSFIYVGLAVFVFAAYYLALWLDNTFFGGSYSIGGYLSAIAIAPLFLLGFNYVRRFLKRAANKYFFTGLYDYQQVLETFAKKVSQTIKLDAVITVVTDTIQGALRVDDIAVALSDKTNQHPFLLNKVVGFNKQDLENIFARQAFLQYLQSAKQPVVIDELLSSQEEKDNPNLTADARLLKDLGVSLVLPFVVKDEINSVCVVGRKITKEAYTKEDIDLLTTLSNQASVAIENARLYNNMEDIVESQTHEIKAKNVHLQKLLDMRSKFLTTASHQLRTPVSVMLGVMEMTHDGSLDKVDEKTRKSLMDGCYVKALKLENIIEDILDAAEMDTRKFALTKELSEDIRIEELVDRVVKFHELDTQTKVLDLAYVKPKESLPLIKGSRKHLDQVLNNLVDNAIKYTPKQNEKTGEKGKVMITCGAKDDFVFIKIKDNGIGIPKDEIKNVGEKFIRASNAKDMYADGTGVGVFIAKEIIEGHGGKLEAESELGKGAAFTIWLPISK